ncbi:uncharacterized protein AAG666_021955 isoform 2-T2 [Megaptera novaeangliae]
MGCWILDQVRRKSQGEKAAIPVTRSWCHFPDADYGSMIPTSSVDTQGRRAEWISELEAASSTSVEIVAIVFIQLPAQSSEQSICSVEHIWNEYENIKNRSVECFRRWRKSKTQRSPSFPQIQ